MNAERDARLRALYEAVDRRVGASTPKCAVSGRCCDFPVAGHTLFATAIEADLVADAVSIPEPEAPGWCPFYRKRLCTLRDLRPVGCRVYFCDPDYQANAMEDDAAWAHAELQALHRELDLAYRYAPFVDLLAERARSAEGRRGDAPQ